MHGWGSAVGTAAEPPDFAESESKAEGGRGAEDWKRGVVLVFLRLGFNQVEETTFVFRGAILDAWLRMGLGWKVNNTEPHFCGNALGEDGKKPVFDMVSGCCCKNFGWQLLNCNSHSHS